MNWHPLEMSCRKTQAGSYVGLGPVRNTRPAVSMAPVSMVNITCTGTKLIYREMMRN